MIEIKVQIRYQPWGPIFDAAQNKPKNFPLGILIQIGKCR